eukprot:TRINITY_DN34489_c0_g1_i1.p1 TRINITY_DN34489_c0_g1~~TRINITY_DN34489_c0_g1_i1.p1  ORF type:complete len:594 (-),score=51.23 TRINITY_DN34489_c0_g1_i1:164-1945(-)
MGFAGNTPTLTVLLLQALVVGHEVPPPRVPLEVPCSPSVVPNSNTVKTPCKGSIGTSCPFVCDKGFIPIGRHVCQSYTTKQGRRVLSNEFFGGRCERLCPATAEPCPAGTAPVRTNSSDSGGPCFTTRCMPADVALWQLARGSYSVWRLGRNPSTGIISGKVNPSNDANSQSDQAHIGINGVGLIMECIAAEMGWITRSDAQQRILLTLKSLSGELPGFQLARQASDGWIPTFFNRSTGEHLGHRTPTYTTLDTGLNSAGVLFAKTYFDKTADRDRGTPGGEDRTREVGRLATKIFQLVRFENLLCDASGRRSDSGNAIPFTFDDEGGCAGLHMPKADGAYDFSELHYVVWLAFNQACAGSPPNHCPNTAIEKMWTAWQERRLHPDHSYKPTSTGQRYPLLSLWSSYIVQLPFYASGSFNSDLHWSALFASHWQADLAYFNSSAYYGGDAGRYGLAAGFTDEWCSAKHTGYEADMLVLPGSLQDKPGAQGCRMYSPYAVAGYLPAAPNVIKEHLLELLASGESVMSLPHADTGPHEFTLLRRSMLEPGWNQETSVSMVDYSSELFGLAALFLGKEFFMNYTNHDWSEFASIVV